ncbi:MAG TPA: hypothetical protein VK821_04360, partial [Dehalococcoidia bacterium]|nr:hypothetical protein [Dehalococcoidia bacterium]
MVAGGGTLLAGARADYARAIVQTGKEPAFLLTLAFLLTFGVVRLITYGIRDNVMPFLHNVTTKSGLHIHHMVPGMLLVLMTGYLGLALTADRPAKLLAILFGIG